MAIVIGDVGADEIVEGAVFGAMLAEVDAAVLYHDLGVHDAAAPRAEAAGGAEVGVVAELHRGDPVRKPYRPKTQSPKARQRREPGATGIPWLTVPGAAGRDS